MGLSTVMSASIIFYTLLVMVGVLAGITVKLLDVTMKLEAQTSQIVLERESIKITGFTYKTTTISNQTFSIINMTLKNDGSTLIYDYPKIDVIVVNIESGKVRVQIANFEGSWQDAIASGNVVPGWYIVNITDATGFSRAYLNSDPVYWEPNTYANIVIVLDHLVSTNTTVTVNIATPGGGHAFLRFTWG
jgi:archaellum component FlaF (FlaF/FlaG flagellin family)